MKRTLLYTGKKGTLSSSKEKHAFVLRQDLSGRAGSVDFDDANNIINISYSDAWPGNFDVMHKKFANFGGGGFTSQRVSWGTGDSTHPAIAAIDSGACIAWSDDTSGNYEILVKKGS